MKNNTFIPEQQSKRDFLKIVFSGGIIALVGSILYPVFSYLIPPKQNEVEVSSIKACTKSEIEKDSGKIVKFGSKPVILIQTAEGNYKAFTATCTHLDCTVQYRKDLGLIWCACHNGKYDLDGRNISGPPPRPLEELKVLIQGEDILISKKA
jgi:cytochrome b6-f complex iron-sulfur subunit